MRKKSVPCLLFLLMVLLHPLPALSGDFITLNQVLENLQARLQWNPDTETGYIDLDGYQLVDGSGDRTPADELSPDRIVFKLGAPWVVINYQHLINTTGILREQGTLVFPAKTIDDIHVYFKNRALRRDQPRIAVILIDAGHGGKDPGAIGSYSVGKLKTTVHEKTVVLTVAQQLNRLLKNAYPDKKVIMTRSDDRYLKLEERTAVANNVELREHEAIIFISIHANASFKKTAKGFEVWYLPPDFRRDLINPESIEEKEIAPILNVLLEEEYTIESITLAKEVLSGFDREVGHLTENRGTKEESWFVVRNAKMPSILVELGFVTNPDEARLLDQDEYLQKLSRAIYTGIRKFVHTFENTKGFTE